MPDPFLPAGDYDPPPPPRFRHGSYTPGHLAAYPEGEVYDPPPPPIFRRNDDDPDAAVSDEHTESPDR